ncbi:MAG: pirin family protein [Cytophagaceae bacterium]|nr:pirin family protein [Cytophagaceae bacterium]MDW8455159.1 pirin family protein [Cytophagaceae bacterium]
MENASRKDFLKKLSMGLLGWVALPHDSHGRFLKSEQRKEEEMQQEHNTIIKKKPMGFSWDTLDPFLFCVHHEDHFPKGNDEMGPDASLLKGRNIGDDFIIKDGWRMYHGSKVPGFPGHPHRGFETITIVRKGLVDHADSMGASGRYGEGDVQWMTAGKGVQHSEMFPLIHKDKENPLELFQIWLNLPAKNKMVEPHFKMLWGANIPKYNYIDGTGRKTTVEVIAGTLYGQTAPAPPPNSWAADPSNEVAIYNMILETGATFVLPKASSSVNRVVYLYQGMSIHLNDEELKYYHLAVLNSSKEVEIRNSLTQPARILMLQGKPIKEHVIQYGPFVMNTKQEIHQAFEDYHRTKFGGWPWERLDQVHPRSEGRFARHANGTYEKGI